jgi:hypothetical protein
MEYKKLILGRLLDKYEKSKSFTDETSNRRILLKMGDRDLPEYDVEKPLVRETFNSVVKELAGKELVGFEWLKYETGNIIDKVWLLAGNVEEAYLEISRKPKRDVLDVLLQYADRLSGKIAQRNKRVMQGNEGVIQENAGGTPENKDINAGKCIRSFDDAEEVDSGTEILGWMEHFLNDVRRNIENRSTVSGLLPDDEEQAFAVLRVFEEIIGLEGGEFLERAFSLRCFGDSKYFEKKVKSRVAGIIRRYFNKPEESVEMTDDEILAQTGILQSPELIEFKGGLVGEINGRSIDFSVFVYGASINSDTVRGLKINGMGQVKRILFIENKANYLDFTSKNADPTLMTVFHGGFYSPLKSLFLKKLSDAATDLGVDFYHWSDIDLGGFLIFNRLKINIIPGLKPYLMDVEALKSRARHAVPIDKKYADKIERLLDDPEFAEFRGVMEYMLEYRIKLEQEAFLL